MGNINYAAFQKIHDRVTDAQAFGLPYDAVAIIPADPNSNVFDVLGNDYWDSVDIGAIMLGQLVDRLISDCPTQRIALLGYSEGAHVIGNLLSYWGGNQGVRDRIAGIVTFGDTRFNPTWPFAQGSFSTSREGAFSARTVSSVWWNKMRAYCDGQDFACGWSPQTWLSCPVKDSRLCGHFSYGASGASALGGAWLGDLAASLPPLSLPPAPVPSSNPFGTLDQAGMTTDNARFFSRGWAIDPNAGTGPVTVHTYLDGVYVGATTANASRPDVGTAYPAYGSNHGYYAEYPISIGTHQVCTYAINVGAGDANPQLPSCKTIERRERLAVVDTNLAASVKDGPLNAGWTPLTTAQQVQLSRNRIAVLQDGVLSVKEGAVNAQWVQQASGVTAFRITDNRIAVLQGDVLSVKEGALNAQWVPVTNGVSSFDMSPNRIAVIQGGTASVKEGPLNSGWTPVTSGVSLVRVTDTRLGVLQGSTLSVKQGAINAGWTQLTSGVDTFELTDNRVAVIGGGTVSAKEGALNSQWIAPITTGASAIQLSDTRLAVLQGSTVSVKEGPLTSGWTAVAGGVTCFDLS